MISQLVNEKIDSNLGNSYSFALKSEIERALNVLNAFLRGINSVSLRDFSLRYKRAQKAGEDRH